MVFRKGARGGGCFTTDERVDLQGSVANHTETHIKYLSIYIYIYTACRGKRMFSWCGLSQIADL
jgi:hypothetical protein